MRAKYRRNCGNASLSENPCVFCEAGSHNFGASQVNGSSHLSVQQYLGDEMEYKLCGKGSCCPSVKIEADGVLIGEDKNVCRLSAGEWNELVELVKSGKVREL